MSETVSQSLHVVMNHVVKSITHYSIRIINRCQIQINLNTVRTAPQQNSSAQMKTQKYIQLPQNTFAFGNKSVAVNALFNSGSDSNLLVENVASYSDLNGKEQSIKFSNAISEKSRFNSKLVNFSVIAQKVKFLIKDFFSKCYQTHSSLNGKLHFLWSVCHQSYIV